MTNANKIMRDGVDSGKSAAAVVAQISTGAPVAVGLTGQSGSQFGQRDNWIARFLSRVFRRLLPLVRPALYRYRQYMNRPILEQLSRIEGRMAIRSEATPASVALTGLSEQLVRIEDYAMNAARRTAVSCGDGRILVRSAAGYVMCGVGDPALLACLIESGDLEPGTRLFIEQLIRPGMTFIDVGANVGMHTLAAGRAMNGMGRIVAFEPYGPTRELLAESIFINGLSGVVEIHEAAVSTKSGTQFLHLGKASGHHSLYPLGEDGGADCGSVPVRLVSLAEVIPAGTRVDLIKIDVEGAELDVLHSARPFIESNPEIALIVEFGPSHLERTGCSVENWFAAFAEMGLVYQEIDSLEGTLHEIEQGRLVQVESANLFFARPGANVWKQACAMK